jgi:hypothetical protein
MPQYDMGNPPAGNSRPRGASLLGGGLFVYLAITLIRRRPSMVSATPWHVIISIFAGKVFRGSLIADAGER